MQIVKVRKAITIDLINVVHTVEARIGFKLFKMIPIIEKVSKTLQLML